jgi:hypothetical protein
MLGVVGILVQNIVKPDIDFMDAGKIVAQSSFAPFGTLFTIQLILMGWVEGRRWQDMRKPGSTALPSGNFLGFENILAGRGDVGYPGGAFDPLQLYKGSEGQLNSLKLKEIKNGRLAMLAYIGISCAYVSTGKGPLDSLYFHLSDPWSHSVASNTYALPFLPR